VAAEPLHGPSPGARALAGAGAIVVAGLFGVNFPANLWSQGYRLSATAAVVTTTPLVVFLALLALNPDGLQRLVAKRTSLRLDRPSHVGAAVMLAATLYFVIGYAAITLGLFALEQAADGGDGPAITAAALYANLAVNAVILVVPPLVYVRAVHDRHGAALLAALGLRAEGAWRASGIGLLLAVGFLVVLSLAGLVLTYFVEVPENSQALEIARAVTPLGAVVVALLSSVSEEVFFRGFLQPRIGLWGQAAVFALAHLSYVNVLEIVVTFALAVAFGLVYRRSQHLAGPIVAHFTFNLVNLLGAAAL